MESICVLSRDRLLLRPGAERQVWKLCVVVCYSPASLWEAHHSTRVFLGRGGGVDIVILQSCFSTQPGDIYILGVVIQTDSPSSSSVAPSSLSPVLRNIAWTHKPSGPCDL